MITDYLRKSDDAVKSLSLDAIAKKTGGRIIQGTGSLVVHDIVTRIRKIGQGNLLFDLYHDRDEKALTGLRGCSYGIITDTPEYFKGVGDRVTIIQVKDIDEAYWKFVDFYRSLLIYRLLE